jgi:nitronate monooxygenase
MGYASRDELIAFLNELLEAERAGSRVTLSTSRDIEDPNMKTLIAAVQKDEAKWCGVLTKALRAVQGEPSTKVGAFYDKAMAIEDLSARLVFLNRGQGWVVRKLREMLPKIRDESIHGDLTEMLASHERNISLVEAQSSAKGE